jgi:hypothetical protein
VEDAGDAEVAAVVVELRAAAELDPLPDSVCACVPDDVPELAVASWFDCGNVDAIAADPIGVAVSRLGVERLLRAREPMTAIPAKPPVAVTRRARERRR